VADDIIAQLNAAAAKYGASPRAGVNPPGYKPPVLPQNWGSVFSGVDGAAPGDSSVFGAIAGDPGFQAWKTGSDFTLSNAAAQRQAALRALAIKFGGIGNLNDRYGDIDKATLDAASKNPYSDLAGSKRNYDQGVEAFKRGLSARGALQSGDLGYGLDQLDYTRGQSEYDLANQFGGAATSAVNDYANTEADQRRSEAQAILDAAGRVSQWWAPSDGSGAPGHNPQDITDLQRALTQAAAETSSGQNPDAAAAIGNVANPGEDDPAYAAWKQAQGAAQTYHDQQAQQQQQNVVWYRDPSTGEVYSQPSRGGAGAGIGMA
jgi:hypothetical protein